MDLHLDVDSADGRRAGLENALRDAIRQGRLATGARLPASRQFAQELGVSRGTVKAAYDQLVAEGYLTARQGAGTVVASLAAVDSAPESGTARARVPRFDLRPGSPDVGLFPATAWLKALRRAVADAPSSAYDYGDPRGHIALRTALSEYLGRARGVVAGPERIVVVSGAVQGLALLTRVLEGGTVAMEDPGLPFHRDVVRHGGGRVVPVRVDELGVCPEDLRAADAVVVTPAHQYPTGVTLHPSRRRALTDWARARGALVVEDDYDGEFRYDRQPVGALQGMAPGQVVYLGTASKTLGPALRLGWMVLPPHLVDAVVDAKLHSDHSTEVVGQLALAELLTSHAYDRHVRACRLRYRRRRDLLVARLGERWRVRGIAAGLHALVEVDGEERVLALAEAEGLAVGRLAEHWHDRASGQGLVVGYGTPREGAYPQALEVLARVLERGR